MKRIKHLTARPSRQLNCYRLLLLLILCLLCSPFIALLWASTEAKQQQAIADAQADAFFSQFPATSLNESAQQIDRLGAALGFSPNARYQSAITIDQVAAEDFRQIDQSLTRFLQEQAALVSGPLAPLPADLATYLSVYSSRINRAQQQILSGSPPQWEMTPETVFNPDYPLPGFFNILYLQKLILLRAIDHHHQGKSDQMLSAMDASWRLNQAIAQRPDLVSQLLSSIVLAQQASLLRHLEAIPAHWQTRLASRSPQQAILTGLQFENWLKYKISQGALLTRQKPEERPEAPSGGIFAQPPRGFSNKLSSGLFSWLSVRPYFKLKTIKAATTTHVALDWLAATDICATPQVTVEKTLRKLQVDRGEAEVAFSSVVIAKRWKDAGDRALAIELSQHVLAAKQRANETWPANLSDLDSQTCIGERWVYEPTEESMTLSLSKQLATGTMIPLKYTAE